jgi:hypothetical protein
MMRERIRAVWVVSHGWNDISMFETIKLELLA